MQFSESTDSEDLHRQIDELQIPNKQHIKNEGINIIAYLHSKPHKISIGADSANSAISATGEKVK